MYNANPISGSIEGPRERLQRHNVESSLSEREPSAFLPHTNSLLRRRWQFWGGLDRHHRAVPAHIFQWWWTGSVIRPARPPCGNGIHWNETPSLPPWRLLLIPPILTYVTPFCSPLYGLSHCSYGFAICHSPFPIHTVLPIIVAWFLHDHFLPCNQPVFLLERPKSTGHLRPLAIPTS